MGNQPPEIATSTPLAEAVAPSCGCPSIDGALELGGRIVKVVHLPGYKPAMLAPWLAKDAGWATLGREKMVSPRFLTACPTFHEAQGFIDYVKAMSDDTSRIFYDQAGTFLAVLDYHAPLDLTGDADETDAHNPGDPRHGDPRHGDHLAKLVLKNSPEWDVWMGRNGQAMGQQEFAEFLEDNARDLLEPDAAAMLDVATRLTATNSATFRSAQNLNNGTVQFAFDENIEAKVGAGSAAVPTTFRVGLRPFMGSARFGIEARFRFRLKGSTLALHYKLMQPQVVLEDSLEAIVLRVREETQLPVALGAHNAEAFKRGE